MIKYQIEIGSTDVEGIGFIKNLIHFSSLGGKLIEKAPLRNRFPHKALMSIESETPLEERKGVIIKRLDCPYTKDELENMEWGEFKELLKKHDIGGRHRAVMINKYLDLFN